MSTLNSVIQIGTAAAIPAAAIPGRLYFTSDTLHVLRDNGTAWVDCTPSGGSLANPMTTAGDIIIGGTGGTPARLAAGASGSLLSIASGVPAYVAGAASATTDTTNASNITSGTLPAARLPLATSSAFGGVKVDGTTITAAAGVISAMPTALPSGAANLVLASPNGSTGVASLRALVAADVPTLNQSTTGTAGGLSTALLVTQGGLATAAAPAAAQIPIAQSASAYAPTTVSGDGTLSSAGALAVTKTGGVAFAPSATTDTTNASNITSGTLPAARLPLATSSAFGGVKVDGTTITAASGVISATPTALPSGAANLVLASPNGSTGIASLRALVANDIPSALNASTFTNLTVSGGHLVAAVGTAPTVAVQSGAGTGASATLGAGSNDMSGAVNLSTGSSGIVASSAMVTVTFHNAYAAIPKVFLFPSTNLSNVQAESTAQLSGGSAIWVIPTTTGFSICSNTTTLSVNGNYAWNYLVIG